MYKKFLTAALGGFLFLQSFGQTGALLRYPAIDKEGNQVAFTYQGDVWVQPLNTTGPAKRLTLHEAYDYHPVWSTDGKSLAFASDRYGGDDIFTVPVAGGTPSRLTFHSTSDIPHHWTEENNLLFTTRRVFAQVEREREIHTIATRGGMPKRIMDAMGDMVTQSPDGNLLAFTRGHSRAEREDYSGPANHDIWIYNKKADKYIQLTQNKAQDIYPKFAGNNTLVFLSARDGKYNVYQIALTEAGEKSGNFKQRTDFTDEGIRHFDVSEDGNTLVFERKASVYVKRGEAKATALQTDLTADSRFVPREHKTFRNQVSAFQPSPNGKLVVFEIRGELFLARNNKENKRTITLTKHASRDEDAVWLNDSTLLFVSNRDGNNEIYKISSADEQQSSLLQTMIFKKERLTKTQTDEKQLTVAPDGKHIAYVEEDGNLVVAEVNKKGIENKTYLLKGWQRPGDISWSPDSKWLAYVKSDLYGNSEVYVHKADNTEGPVNVSMHPKADREPFWSKDGSKLGFTSLRNNGDTDVWFAWLKKEDWQRTQDDWYELEEENNENDKDKKVEIDLKNIHQRLVQVTSLPGNESNVVISDNGETFYFVTNRNSRQTYNADQDLFQVDWDGKNMKPLTKGNQRPSNLQLTPDGKELMYLVRGTIKSMNLKASKAATIPFSADMVINYAAEREVKFEEGWKIIQEGFYDPQFHGNDWEALKEQYKPYCMMASTDRDFEDMFNRMLGQLNASHMGLYSRDRVETEREYTGLLGVELEPHKKGAEITYVVPDSPADREESKLNEGDILLAIDQVPVNAETNIYEHLINKHNEKMLLRVKGTDGQERDVVLRGARSLSSEKYDAWVASRRQLTDKYSDGKLGYLHIRGMNWTSFERFERELMAAGHGKEGIVIDVRFNGGGWTTDYLMAVLTVRQHAYTIPRTAIENLEKEHQNFTDYYPYSERAPLAVWNKPSIAMCNEASYSNAEIFSHAYKTLGLGKLVGQPTFGAVISTGGARLVDGSYIRLPFRAWYTKGDQMNMENGPAVPDIIVNNAPDDKANDRDPQLKRAVEELLKDI
ncbi:MAG: S41 family peptidase [Bacteroidales bacterium]